MATLLKYIPVASKERSKKFRSSIKTTVPSNPRLFEDDKVELVAWDSFDADVIAFYANAVATDPPMSEERRNDYARLDSDVFNEANVESLHDKAIFMPLALWVRTQQMKGKFSSKNAVAALNPDYCYWTEDCDVPKLRAVIEMKTDWALRGQLQHLGTLVRAWNAGQVISLGGDDYKKLKRSLEQTYGYMSVNHLRYGVLTTYENTVFLRRAKQDPNVKHPVLQISPCVSRGLSEPYTIMQAWAYMLTKFEHDTEFWYSSPYTTPILGRKSIPKVRYNFPELANEEISFAECVTHGQLGSVIRGRVYKAEGSMLKVVDASKEPKMLEKLKHEAKVYKRLIKCQGVAVPKLIATFNLHGWIFGLAMPNCGTPITVEELRMNIKTLRDMLTQLHDAKVAHGDVALRNILVDKGEIRLIDFSESILNPTLAQCEADLTALKELAKDDQ